MSANKHTRTKKTTCKDGRVLTYHSELSESHRPSVVKYLKERVSKRHMGHASKCWIWIGTIEHTGYAVLKLDGKYKRAHRLSWELFKGKIPDRLLVCHSCDVRRCVNPEHLFLGTHKENMQYCSKKNRFNSRRGELNPRSKLTNKDVSDIRSLYVPMKFGYGKLAKKFGVDKAIIARIILRQRWNHIP